MYTHAAVASAVRLLRTCIRLHKKVPNRSGIALASWYYIKARKNTLIHERRSDEAVIKMATHSELDNFSVNDLCDFVSQNLPDVVEDHHDILRELQSNKITGRAFLNLTDEDLKELIGPIGDRMALKSIIEGYRPQTEVY